MTLEKHLSVVPPSNSTSYYQVSRSGLLCAILIANPFAPVIRRFTVVMLLPLLVSSFSLTVTPMKLSKLSMSSTSRHGYSIIFPYPVLVGVVLSSPYAGSYVSHCGISLPSYLAPNPLKSSIMQLVLSKHSINARSNAFIHATISGLSIS